MKKYSPKIIAWILSLVMILSNILPTTAHATDNTNKIQIEQTINGYSYYNLQSNGTAGEPSAVAENSYTEKNKGTVTTSKVITPTEKENEFLINLQVSSTEDLSNLNLSEDAAVVLVLDRSGSMQWDLNGDGRCKVEGCKHEGEYISGDADVWWHIWGEPSRFEAMSNSLVGTETSKGFLDSFVKDAGNAQRKLSVVTFGGETEPTTVLGWTDVTTEAGMNAVKTEVSFENLITKIRNQTSPGHGFIDAINLLQNDAEVKEIANKYVILLTDGRPEGSTDISNGKHAEEQAKIIKENCNATLYAIGFGTQNVKMETSEKRPVNEWLKENIASNGCFIAAQTGEDLDLGLEKISQTIKEIANAWHVTDPMGENIVFEGFISNSDAATYSENTINWDLNKEDAKSSDGKIIYDLQYKIRLDNTKTNFEAEKNYLANGFTDLSYFFIEEIYEDGKIITSNTDAIKHLNFKVPAVNGFLGNLYINKIAEDNKALLDGATFELIHAGNSCSTCNGKVSIASYTATSSENGDLIFANIPSGHEYILKETNAPTGFELSEKEYSVNVSYGKVFVDNVECTKESPIQITNKPILTTISGEKIWDDANNQDGIRPKKIKVNLFADGKKVASQDVIPDENGKWTYAFEKMRVYTDEGVSIEYTVSEDLVDGYISSTSKDNYDITNTHSPEKISVVGKKTWDDNNNQDGVRPDSITINLFADGEMISSKVVTADDDWAWSFDELDKYCEGSEITYSISESEVVGYTSVINGFNVVNTHAPAVTSVEGSKTWDDADNQDGVRPDSITINLFADGEKISSKVVTADDDWAWSFKNLPKYKDQGIEIVYTITEDAVENYTSVVDGFDVTNTHIPTVISVEGSKTWDDADNQDGIRPEKITINLYADGEKIDSKVVTATDNWAWSFENLPKYKDQGVEIVYTIAEDAVENYTAIVDGYDVTNIHTPAVISVEGSKTWNDADNQDGIRPEKITINLYADGEKIDSKVVTATDNWAWSFKNLPEYKAGQKIVYSITEDAIEGYETTVTGYDVTNTHEPEKTSVSGSKTWVDNNNQDGKRPESITVNLLANGEVVATKEVTATDNWTWTFENLDKYKAGEELLYTVEEEIAEGYNPTYDGLNITNTYDPEKLNVIGHKIWNDDFDRDGIRPESITIYLYADGELVDKQTVTALNAWTWSFEGLDRYRDGGVEIIYTIAEKPVKGYTTAIVGHNIVNTHIPKVVDLKGTKTWNDNNDQDGIRPESIEVILHADGIPVAKQTVTADTNWKYVFKNLPKYRHHGIEILYTVSETPVDGYTTTVNGHDIVNTHVPAITNVTGTKTWDDNNNQDGIRPESITIKLLADGKVIKTVNVSEKDTWTWSFDNLPKYRDGGVEIVYTVEEDAINGYETVINGFNVTNTHIPEVTSVTGTKTWDDEDNQDGIRPESITINLLANDEVVETLSVSDEDAWTWSFDNLPKYKDGVEIVYTITEDAVDGYETVIDGYDVTNTHIPEIVTVEGSKTWDDENDKDGIRPGKITIYLLANGEVIEKVKVKEKDNWSWTFEELPKYENGVEIEYTIDEKEVKGYETQIDGYDVINIHEVAPEESPVPDTGDHSNTAFPFLMMCVTAATIKAVLEYKRSFKRR